MAAHRPPASALARLIDAVRRRQHLILGALATVLFVLLLAAIDQVFVGSAGWGYDFAAYHAAAERLLTTGSPYLPSTLEGPFKWGLSGLYLYSPLPVVVLLPLTGLTTADAAMIFVAAKLALFVATCALLPVRGTVRLATVVVACVSAPVLQDLNLGNVSLVVTFLAVVAWRWLDRPAGSLAVAAALAVRPTMGLFVGWWLLRGRWRAVAWLVVAGLVLFLLSLPFVGLRSWLDYATGLGNLAGFETVSRNFALGAVAWRSGAPEWLAPMALFGGYAIAAIAVWLSMRRDRELSFMVTLGATLLLSPLLWDHYLTNLLVPAAFLAERGRRWGLLLPLLCWLPQDLLPLVAVAAMLLPFAAPDRGEMTRSLLDRVAIRRAPLPA